MKKYDCSKALDLIHEYRRLCDSHPAGCDNDCPLCGMDYCNLYSFDEDKIALLQKWSDENPEPPKLTRKERDFLNCFNPVNKYIKRQCGVLVVTWKDPTITLNAMEIPIDATMFQFVEKGQKWSFDDLLKLEVADD